MERVTIAKKIKMVELRSGYIANREEIDAAFRRVMESGWYILGKEVREFEEKFAQWCGAEECVGVGNGTDAIEIALRSFGIGAGDAVFTVSHTAVATVAAIELAGATPVLVDIEPDYYTLDPRSLEKAVLAIKNSRAKATPRAVIAVHLYGQPCDLLAIKAICEEHSLILIEDCAQAHGATIGKLRVGSVGTMASFSFYPTKNLGAFGDAGAIITSDREHASTCRALREYGWKRRYYSDMRGVNSRLDELHAAILSTRLKHLDSEISVRRRIAARYGEHLADVIDVPAVRENCEHAYHLYVIRTKNRESLRAFLDGRGIESGVHYPFPVHEQLAYRDRIIVGPGGLPVTERLRDEIVSLPIHPFLSDDDVETVIAAIREWKAAGD